MVIADDNVVGLIRAPVLRVDEGHAEDGTWLFLRGGLSVDLAKTTGA